MTINIPKIGYFVLIISVLVAVSFIGVTFRPAYTENQTRQVISTASSGGLTPNPSPIRDFGTVTTLDEAISTATNLKIKLPDPSTLPRGYTLQAVLVEPSGPEIPETFTRELFRPETIHLYYSDKPVDGSMIASEHPDWIVISESYSLGNNSTKPYTVNQTIPSDMTVGWFYGYPGYMRGGTLLVYQFNERTVYRVYSAYQTQEQVLAIAKSLLLTK
jgi:hypothetical protein